MNSLLICNCMQVHTRQLISKKYGIFSFRIKLMTTITIDVLLWWLNFVVIKFMVDSLSLFVNALVMRSSKTITIFGAVLSSSLETTSSGSCLAMSLMSPSLVFQHFLPCPPPPTTFAAADIVAIIEMNSKTSCFVGK